MTASVNGATEYEARLQVYQVFHIPEAPDKLLEPSPATRMPICPKKRNDRRDGIFHLYRGDRLPQSAQVAHRALEVCQGRRFFLRLAFHRH